MKKISVIVLLFFFTSLVVMAQKKEIKAEELPKEVVDVLNQYLNILSTSTSLDDCATKVLPIAGGHLLAQSGNQISNDIKPYSLKKDFENVKFYCIPAVITRFQKEENSYDGYGPTLIEGTWYKIWVAKKEGTAGLPAPIPIIVPKKDTTKPKVVSVIGSL